MKRNVKNKKYLEIQKTSRELFWKHGFRRVTIQEICDKAGVSKMTFYKYFRNKIELAKTVFTNEVEEGTEKFNQLIEEDIPVAEKIRKMILLKVEGTNNISREFMEDFYLGNEPELQNFVEEKTQEAWNGLLNNWEKAQKSGFFRSDFKPEFLLHISFKMVELLKDEKLSKLYKTPQDLILEFTRFIAYGISPQNK
ncbi:MAG: TetR/AcrR family transcriptional regulator [Prolixibacteraceae bacterium]|nr:TetR/AcrR family transcriptional regulator [Prolixibacteraceae bacterium]